MVKLSGFYLIITMLIVMMMMMMIIMTIIPVRREFGVAVNSSVETLRDIKRCRQVSGFGIY